jgi:AcrR family transcriptional regulator
MTERRSYDHRVSNELPVPPADEPANAAGPVVRDERLLAAAARVLEDAGWQGLTIEAVAEAAGLSRVTAWRLGASREALIASLLDQLDRDYKQAMWPVIVGAGSARQRLDRAMDALFDVIDAHLPLLLAADTIFHRASTSKLSFNEPFIRLFEDGRVDGSVAQIAADAQEASDVLFNVICWPYAHLRVRHGWTAELARRRLAGLIGPSLDPSVAAGPRSAADGGRPGEDSDQ